MTPLDFITALHPAAQLVATLGLAVAVAAPVVALSWCLVLAAKDWRERRQAERQRGSRGAVTAVVAGLLLLGSFIASDWPPFLLGLYLDTGDAVVEDADDCVDVDGDSVG